MPKMAWARFSHQLSKILKKHMPAALKVDWFLSVRKSYTLCRQLAWLSVMTGLVVSLGHFLVACHSSHACNLNAGTSLEESTRISFCATSALCCCALGWSCTGCWSGGVVVDVGNKLGGCSSFNNHVCSGTVSQVTPLASHQHANTSCTKGWLHPVLCLWKTGQGCSLRGSDGPCTGNLKSLDIFAVAYKAMKALVSMDIICMINWSRRLLAQLLT